MRAVSGVRQASFGARSAGATGCPQGVKHRYISNGGQQLLMPGLKCCCKGERGCAAVLLSRCLAVSLSRCLAVSLSRCLAVSLFAGLDRRGQCEMFCDRRDGGAVRGVLREVWSDAWTPSPVPGTWAGRRHTPCELAHLRGGATPIYLSKAVSIYLTYLHVLGVVIFMDHASSGPDEVWCTPGCDRFVLTLVLPRETEVS